MMNKMKIDKVFDNLMGLSLGVAATQQAPTHTHHYREDSVENFSSVQTFHLLLIISTC